MTVDCYLPGFSGYTPALVAMRMYIFGIKSPLFEARERGSEAIDAQRTAAAWQDYFDVGRLRCLAIMGVKKSE